MESNLAELAARHKSEDCVTPQKENECQSPTFKKGHFRRSSYESAKIQLDHKKFGSRRGPLYVGRVNSLNSCDLNEATRSATVVTFNLDKERARECSTSFASIETVPTMDSGLGSVCSKRSSLDRRSQASSSVYDCCSTSDFDNHSSPRLCEDAGFVEEEEDELDLRNGDPKPSTQQNQVPPKRRIALPALNIAKTLFSRNRPSDTGSKLWRQNNRIFKESSCFSTTGLIFENRPSNLPAKSEEEAAKHRALYQELIEQAKKKEAKEAKEQKRLRELQRKMEDQVAASCKIWTEQIVPKWTEMKSSKKCKELWWQGIPSLVRGRIWSLVIGNELNLTPDLYEICCNRARSKLEDMNKLKAERSISCPEGASSSPPSSPTSRENTLDSIQLDVGRTFPHLGIFQEGGPYYDLLINLLGAYVCYRPDIGYVQSMSFIAAVLLLQMDPYPAFVAFANLLNRQLQVTFYRLRKPQMTAYFIAFDQYFEQELPDLYAHFDAHDVRSDIYLIEWIYTIFSKSLPLDVTCRIWDVYLRDGEDFIFKTAIGILRTFEPHLLSLEFDDIVHFLCHIPDTMTSVELFSNIEPLMKPYINTGETAKCKRSFLQILSEVNERVHPYHHLYATEGLSSLNLDTNVNGLSNSASTSSGLSTSPQTCISGIKISRSLSFFLRDMLKSPPAASSEQSFVLKKENGLPLSNSSCNLSN